MGFVLIKEGSRPAGHLYSRCAARRLVWASCTPAGHLYSRSAARRLVCASCTAQTAHALQVTYTAAVQHRSLCDPRAHLRVAYTADVQHRDLCGARAQHRRRTPYRSPIQQMCSTEACMGLVLSTDCACPASHLHSRCAAQKLAWVSCSAQIAPACKSPTQQMCSTEACMGLVLSADGARPTGHLYSRCPAQKLAWVSCSEQIAHALQVTYTADVQHRSLHGPRAQHSPDP
ncbi:hypothetical protein NDU88_000550 [Pleurodeles waltl]|uniref:Uncharacterized protein n=1 Tax=Pleurodeles waltl TaxID=8319 RepID=A0AAV7V5D2_PLEWA|nr:hypothetical protein NDU88_000550 [Pleurodeles waltl]